MTIGPRVELELDHFLAEGPEVVADRVIEAALLEIETTTQRPAWFGPWRIPNMTALKLLAGTAVVVLAVGGTLLFTSSGRFVGTPSPSPSPSAAARSLVPFTSPRYEYTLSVPSGWRQAPSTQAWKYGEIAFALAPYLDRFTGASTGDPWVDDGVLIVGSQRLEDGVAPAAWLDAHVQRNQDSNPDECGGRDADWEVTDVQGNPARRGTLVCEGQPVTEIAFVAGDTGWVLAGDTVVVDAVLPTLVLPN